MRNLQEQCVDIELRRRGDFPVDQPLAALEDDHGIARRLFDRYFQSRDEGERNGLGHHILLLLEMHDALEEEAFYPRVRDIDPALVDGCEQDHKQVRELTAMLLPMAGSDPDAERRFRELADAFFKHVEVEEQQLFPKVRQANLDLSDIGQEMEELEVKMIADRSQRPVAPGLR